MKRSKEEETKQGGLHLARRSACRASPTPGRLRSGSLEEVEREEGEEEEEEEEDVMEEEEEGVDGVGEKARSGSSRRLVAKKIVFFFVFCLACCRPCCRPCWPPCCVRGWNIFLGDGWSRP